MEKELLLKMIRIGIPSGLQNSIIGLSNVVIQSYINSYGEMAMAGIGAYSKIEGFAFIPITSFSLALTTFVSQNLGAGKRDRVQEGVRFGTVTGIVLAVAVGALMDGFAPQLVGAFDSTKEAVAFGVGRARVVCPFFCLVAFTHLMAAILRGYGKATVPMVDFLICWCVVRILIIAVGGQFIHSIRLTYWVYPITWVLSSVSLFVYYRREEKTLLAKSL
jgi:Na+-driven multidrug efflux pump